MYKKLLDTLQRRTSSQAFIPEIDGLRFVDITAVVLYHIAYFLSEKDMHVYAESVALFCVFWVVFGNFFGLYGGMVVGVGGYRWVEQRFMG